MSDVKVKYTKMSRSRGRNALDEIWKVLVKNNHLLNGKPCCAVCGGQNMVQAHHVIGRSIYAYRWEPVNGVPLCALHHDACVWQSAHHAPWWWLQWLKENKSVTYEWLYQHCWDRPTKTADDFVYDEIYSQMEELHKQQTGVYFKADRCIDYRLSKAYDQILVMLSGDSSIKQIMAATGAGDTALKKFIGKNPELRRLLKARTTKGKK